MSPCENTQGKISRKLEQLGALPRRHTYPECSEIVFAVGNTSDSDNLLLRSLYVKGSEWSSSLNALQRNDNEASLLPNQKILAKVN